MAPGAVPGGPPPGKKGGLAQWARKNKALAAAGAGGAGLIAFVLYKRNQQNSPADTADTPATLGGTIPAQFSGDGGSTDPFGPIEQQLAGLQTSINALTQAQHPPPGFSWYAAAKAILLRQGIKNPTRDQIMRERRKLLKLGNPPAPHPAPKPAPRKFPGGVIVGKRR